MNVNALNSINSMKKISSTPAFSATNTEKQKVNKKEERSLAGLEALAAMLTPHKHFVQLDFNTGDDSTFKLSSGISTIDDKEKEVVSSLEIDKKEGKTKTDIINSLLRDTTDLKEFSMDLKDGSSVAVIQLKGAGHHFVSTLSKDGCTDVINQFTFSCADDSKASKMEAYKKAINLAISSVGSSNITGVTVATQK